MILETTTKILTETEVIGFQKHADSSYTISFKNGGNLVADAVVFAIGANTASNILKHLDSCLAELLQQIPFTSSGSVSLGYKLKDLQNIPKGYGITIPAREKRKISAITFSSQKWDNRVPRKDFGLIRVFVVGYNNPEIVTLDDETLVNIVKSEIKDLIGISSDSCLIHVNRWKDGRPQYTIGHLDKINKIKERLVLHPSLFLAESSYNGAGLSDCIFSGVNTAKIIVETFYTDIQIPSEVLSTQNGQELLL